MSTLHVIKSYNLDLEVEAMLKDKIKRIYCDKGVSNNWTKSTYCVKKLWEQNNI